MESTRLAALLALVSALSLQPSALVFAAPLGAAFTYQGRLQQAGLPADGSYDFLFRLYDAPTNGSQLGPLVRTNAVLVNDGLFMVALDFGSDTFTGDERWLQISVQTNGAARFTLLSPRQLLTPAPWAQFALKSASAGSSAFAATAGGVAGSNLIASADGTLTLRAPSIAVESDRFTNTVTGSASQVVGVNSEVVVGAHLSVSAGGNYEQTIGGDVTQTLGKDLITDVSRNHVLSVGGNMALSVSNALTATCAQAASIDVGEGLVLRANDEIWLISGSATLNMKKNGDITIKGKKINIRGTGEIVMKQGAAFRSAATETNETSIGILGESATTNGIGVLGIATSTGDDDVHAGVLAVADAGNKRIALLANCVTNDLLPAAAVPRPAAIAGRALANQDILQGYGKNHALTFRVSDGGVVTATAFEGDGAGLTGIGAEALADNSVNAAKVADGTLGVADLSSALASNTFWRLDGNAATVGGTHFLGTRDNQPVEIRVNNNRVLRIDYSGSSPNFIAGSSANLVSNGVVGATISGGGNVAAKQVVGNHYSTIGGGSGHTIQARDATIAGGTLNRIESGAAAAVISGGANNEVRSNCTHAVVAGGWDNEIQAASPYAAIGGGTLNVIQRGGYGSKIGGGEHNTVGTNARTAFLGGGNQNSVASSQAALAGGYFNAIHTNATDAFLGGGSNNTISNAAAAILAGGHLNAIRNARQAVLVGGTQNQIQGGTETVLVGGSFNMIASGDNSVIGGGRGNTVVSNASYATIPGGQDNSVQGQHAFAAGRRAKALHAGAFVWADSTAMADFPSTANNQFSVRATGGVRMVTGIDGGGISSAGASLDAGGTSWNVLSDRAAKKNFRPVDARAIVEQLAQVPVQRWNYHWESDAAVPHLGPTAQDFKSAFYPGRDDTHISTLEFDGVAFAAIQGLNAKVEGRSQKAEGRIRKLEAENTLLKQELAELKALVQTLAEKVNGGGR